MELEVTLDLREELEFTLMTVLRVVNSITKIQIPVKDNRTKRDFINRDNYEEGQQ